MEKVTLSRVYDQLAAVGDDNPAQQLSLLEQHEALLRENGMLKLLVLAYYRAGRLRSAYRLIGQIDTDALSGDERRTMDNIRHEWSSRIRGRFGLPAPSGKPISKRLVDGTRNLLRHGRLRNPSSPKARIPNVLKGVSEQIRVARTHDVDQLRNLLDRHEDEYRDRGHLRFLAFNYYHAGSLEKAASYARGIDRNAISADEKAAVGNILFEWRALKKLRAGMPPITLADVRRSEVDPATPIRSLYLAASSLPHVVSGYTSRSEAIVAAMLKSQKLELFPMTRPGFPDDRRDARRSADKLDGSTLFATERSKVPFRGDLEAYLSDCLPRLEEVMNEQALGLVHGVSNYRNGAIGLALARRTGKPFVYEVRGLWEETADSKLRGWRNTERFEFERLFEQFLYRSADGVLTINEQVRNLLEVETRENVGLLPNCVSRDRIVLNAQRASRPKLKIGYVGSILEYEGLDDLCRSIDRLQSRGHDVALDIYGKGMDEDRLRTLAGSLPLRNVAFRGAVPSEQVDELYSEFDLCVFARKPYRVCELVTPIKPLEAMANDVNVIVSDVAPLMPFVRDGGALSFEAGNLDELTRVIEHFIELNDDQRRSLRDRSRAMLEHNYVWEDQSKVIAAIYRGCFEQGKAG